MSNIIKHKTREEWLEAAVESMTPRFKQYGYEVPAVRVSCGWPVRGGGATKKRVLGECWTKDASADRQRAQIFISPVLSETSEPMGVLATLVHEVVHAVVGHKAGHNKVFGICARAVGLVGKMTSTNASESLIEAFEDWIKVLGPYPHSQLKGLKTNKKKQGTRLLKCECPECGCGYTVRTTAKWLEIGAPICPVHNVSMAGPDPKDRENEGAMNEKDDIFEDAKRSDTSESKPKFIVVSAVKQLVKDLGNQSAPDFLTALDAQVSASVRKACNDEGPNKRLREASLGMACAVVSSAKIDDKREKLKELRDTAACAVLQVNIVTKNDYLKFFNAVKDTLENILNEK